jgi:hypothetical protein
MIGTKMLNNQTTSEIFHQVFKDVPGQPFSEIYHNIGFAGIKDEDHVEGGIKEFDGTIQYWHPSLPQDTAVVIAMHDGQGFLLRYPDNTYHHLDIGGYEEIDGIEYLSPELVDEDEERFLYFLQEILNEESTFWAYGLITDEKVQERILSGEFNELKETLPDTY